VGDRLVFWAGEKGPDARDGYSNAGEVLNLNDRTWKSTAESPIQGRALAGVASNDEVMFVWGGTRVGTGPVADGATYDPKTNSWQKVSASPLSARVPLGIVWNGDEFVVVGGVDAGGNGLSDVAAYNPHHDKWRQLPPLPAVLTAGKVVQVGGLTLVIGTVGDPAPAPPLKAFLLDDIQGSHWISVPAPEIDAAQLALTSVGTDAFAGGYATHRSAAQPQSMKIQRFDLATWTWIDLPSPPVNEMNCDTVLAATSAAVVVDVCSQTAVFDRKADKWTAYQDFTFGDRSLTTPLVSNDVAIFNGGTLFFSPH
jgi:hypothetical protein